MQCSLHRFDLMAKIAYEKVGKELKLVKVVVIHLGLGGLGDCSTKLFGGHKLCYDGQWSLTSLILNAVIIDQILAINALKNDQTFN